MTAQLTREGAQATAAGPVAPAGRGPLGRAAGRVRVAVQEMNYAARRVVELQAPWGVDEQWHRR